MCDLLVNTRHYRVKTVIDFDTYINHLVVRLSWNAKMLDADTLFISAVPNVETAITDVEQHKGIKVINWRSGS